MLLVEVLDRLFELNLGRAEWVDLHEHLQIEECLRDRELVGTARGGQEVREFRSIGQLEDNVVDLSQGLGVDKDAILPVQDGRHEQLSDFIDVRVLELYLTVDPLDRDWKHGLEGRDKLLPPLGDKLFTLLDYVRWLNIVMMQGRHLDLDSFDPVAADEAHLRRPGQVLVRRDGCFGQLEADKPLDLALELGSLRVQHNARDVQRA